MLTTQADVATASKIALTGVALLFIIAYRGVVKPLLAVFCLLLALCWTIGFTTMTIGHLNILSIVFTTILIGLGIDFGIHILERYKEERQNGHEILEALQKTVQGTGRGNFSGAITTAMAFGAMVLTDFIGIVELGWIAGWGILFCMVAMLLVLPALVTLEEKWRKPHYALIRSAATKQRQWIDKLFDHYYLIIGLCTLLVLIASVSLKDLRFDYNLLNLQAKGTEAVQYEMKILESAGRSAWSAAMLADSLEEVRKKELQLKALPTVARFESISVVIPEHQEEKLRAIRENLAPLLKELHLTPLVLIALATGMRRGELFNLHWQDIDLTGQLLTVVGAGAKSAQSRHIPLHTEALAVLTNWQRQRGDVGRVFTGRHGRLVKIDKAWRTVLRDAKIDGFRFHDLRHSFASSLIQKGVSPYVVQKLLGQSSLAMTERYMHLHNDQLHPTLST